MSRTTGVPLNISIDIDLDIESDRDNDGEMGDNSSTPSPINDQLDHQMNSIHLINPLNLILIIHQMLMWISMK